jgi:tripartite-type tricarboxylate transporter receptor subunit TctC
MTFGSWGTNNSAHLCGELINQVFNIEMKHVPFGGAAKAMVAAMSGHVDLAILTPAPPLPNVKAGKLTALAVCGESRLNAYSAAPTIKELGYPEATFEVYEGFATSSKGPKERLDILRSAFERALKDSGVQKAVEGTGQTPFFRNGPELDAFLAANFEKLAIISQKAKLFKE